MIHKISNKTSINETLAKCVDGDTIMLEPGIYKEKIEIYTSNISIIGLDKNNTIITNDDYYHKIMSDYNECNTFRTYSVYVGGNNVRFSNLTIENSSIPSKKYGQAVALHVTGNNFICEDCIIRSAQDTIFTGPLPKDLIERHKDYILNPLHTKGLPSKQHYKKCLIVGDVDFIFGCATAFFEECTIKSVARIKNNPQEPDGYICAPSHPKELEYGYLFYKCDIICEDNVTNVFLGRPWRDYGTAAFIKCNLGNHINPLGFDKWVEGRDKTARFYEYTENCNLNERQPWANILSEHEALLYFDNFINFFKKCSI
jgi:pectinesterase